MTSAIRSMQAADLEAVLAIAAASPEAPQWPSASYAAYLTAELPLLRAAFVAVSGEQILGFAFATLLLDCDENRCELDSMAVHPDARRQGLGAALLHAVLAWAAHRGARRLTLEVRAGNTPAIPLYHRLGMTEEGRRPGYYRHPEEDAVLLGMPVTPVPQVPSFSTEK
jgi:ribosomal-protein-alanine N-acetyltransferase